ncbi:MAG: hypothetical protein ACO29D_02070, partial [Ilumatobacteraceae bacterium]
RKHGKGVVAICGDVAPDARALATTSGLETVSLREQFGDDTFAATTRCIEQATVRWLTSRDA